MKETCRCTGLPTFHAFPLWLILPPYCEGKPKRIRLDSVGAFSTCRPLSLSPINTRSLWHSAAVICERYLQSRNSSEVEENCIELAALNVRSVTVSTALSWAPMGALNTTQTAQLCSQAMMRLFLRPRSLCRRPVCRCRWVQQEKWRVWPRVQQYYGQLPLLLSPRLRAGRTTHVRR